MTAAAVELRDVHAGYDGRDVLHGVSLAVPQGGSLCVVGPNGSGKSTIVSAIMGLCHVSAGSISVAGRDITGVAPAGRIAAGIGCVLQESSVFPAMTVEQNLRLGGYWMAQRGQAREEAARLLDRYPALGRRRNHPAHVLSGGERRLLEVVRALMMTPSLLVADEPSIGLDAHATTMVFALLADLRARGLSILLVEQNLRAGLGFAESGCVVSGGRIVAMAPAQRLLAGDELQRVFLDGVA